MFLSIIIPVYNADKYLAECLDSCLHQDIPYDDYEIICVNDGSEDGCLAILDDYSSRYPNICVIHKENAGVSEARNDGLAIARGDYVWFVDADDFIEENILGLLSTKTNSTGCDRISFPCYELHESFTEEEAKKKANKQLPPNFKHGDNVVWTCLFRRKAIQEYNLKFQTKSRNKIDNTNLMFGEDTLFVYGFTRHDPKQEMLAEFPFYFYRRNACSVTNNFSMEAQIAKMNTYIQLALTVKEDYDRYKLSHVPVPDSTANLMMEFLRAGLARLARMPWKTYCETIKWLRAEGLFPFKQPPECTYTWQQCANEPSDTGKLRNIFRYYSIHPVGLFFAALPYRLQRLKIRLSRFLRSNPLMNAVLNFKNKLLKR